MRRCLHNKGDERRRREGEDISDDVRRKSGCTTKVPVPSVRSGEGRNGQKEQNNERKVYTRCLVR